MAETILRIEIAKCPECNYKILFNKAVRLGDIVNCPECHERLQVYRLKPVQLNWSDTDYDDDYDEWA